MMKYKCISRYKLIGETYSDAAEEYYIVETDFWEHTGAVVEVLDFEATLPTRGLEVFVFDGEGDTRGGSFCAIDIQLVNYHAHHVENSSTGARGGDVHHIGRGHGYEGDPFSCRQVRRSTAL